MTRDAILQTFRKFYRSGKWASAQLGVENTTISQWLHGAKEHKLLANEMPKLAAELQRTNGRCMGKKVNGDSARTKVSRVRSRSKKGKK